MKRTGILASAVLIVTAASAVLSGDVKKVDKVTFKFEGMLGGFINRMAGGAKEGVDTSMTVKGSRLMSTTAQTGQIIDLTEEKVYDLDLRRKEYSVQTFAELRARMEKLREDAKKSMADMKPEEREQMQAVGTQLEFDAAVNETTETRSIAGHEARKVVITVTARLKGQTLEQGGGYVLTNDIWLVPDIPALKEVAEFQLRYIKAVYGEAFIADMQQMAGPMALFPAFKPMAEKMQAETSKLRGTTVASMMAFEAVKSEEQMKAAQSQQSTGGGGISGALARRMMGNRGAPQARTRALTMGSEMQSFSTTVSDADVALPAGFKLKR